MLRGFCGGRLFPYFNLLIFSVSRFFGGGLPGGVSLFFFFTPSEESEWWRGNGVWSKSALALYSVELTKCESEVETRSTNWNGARGREQKKEERKKRNAWSVRSEKDIFFSFPFNSNFFS